VADPQ
jgi:hypothetical protein